jgi:CheY-like chemotaxis protein
MLKILYVDDEADIREIASLALQLDPEIEVRSESSGLDALATAAQWRPDAILLDVMMPHMDGRTTLAKLRERQETREIPVIMITARAQAREVQDYIERGARGVITKPFDPMSLAETLREKIAA